MCLEIIYSAFMEHEASPWLKLPENISFSWCTPWSFLPFNLLDNFKQKKTKFPIIISLPSNYTHLFNISLLPGSSHDSFDLVEYKLSLFFMIRITTHWAKVYIAFRSNTQRNVIKVSFIITTKSFTKNHERETKNFLAFS